MVWEESTNFFFLCELIRRYILKYYSEVCTFENHRKYYLGKGTAAATAATVTADVVAIGIGKTTQGDWFSNRGRLKHLLYRPQIQQVTIYDYIFKCRQISR